MKKLFLRAFGFFLVFLSALTWVPPVSAERASANIFFQAGVNDCNDADHQACDCQFAFRNKDTGEIFVVQGTDSEEGGQPGTVLLVPPEDDLEVAVFARSTGRQENNCYFSHGIRTAQRVPECAPSTSANPITAFIDTVQFAASCDNEDLAMEITALLQQTLFGEWIHGETHNAPADTGSGSCNFSGAPGYSAISEWADIPKGRPSEGRSTGDLEMAFKTEWRGDRGLSTNADRSYCAVIYQYADVFNPTISNDYTTHEDFYLCNQLPQNSDEYNSCDDCYNGNDEFANIEAGVWTAVGCISSKPEPMIAAILRLGISISGGVALLMILAAAFIFTTSQGEPKKVSDAKELLTNAVMGILFILFSVTILQFIGVTILQIPGFGN